MSSPQSGPPQGPPPSSQQSSLQPALPEKSHGRRSSQSSTSEDSQTVLIDPPSSLETSSHNSSDENAETTPQALPLSSGDEPRKCWICFSDETEDEPTASEWISPCPCALKAHQACLLDWIADLESPKRRKAKKIQCPQCKSDIEVMQPHSLSISFVRAIQRISGVLMWPAAVVAASGMVFAGFIAHGVGTTWVLLERHEFNRFVFPRGGFMSLRRCIGVASIPIALITSRTKAGDNILPFLPVIYYASNKLSPRRHAYDGALCVWITALPVIRSLYFGAYRRFLLPYENAWVQEIRPKAAENTEENNIQPDQEGGDEEGGEGGGPLDMDFELGVQIEVEAVEDDGFEHHHHHHHIHEEPQPNNQPAQQQEAAVPEPINIGDNERNANNLDRDPIPNQEAQPEQHPQPQPQAQPRQRPVIQNFIFAIPDFNRLSIGALVFPFVSYYVGELLKHNLPSTWVRPPGYWYRGNGGILQTRYGRTIVGGCLFVVLKDTLFLYSKYSMAQNHKQRRVLNFGEIKKPWYQKNLDELIAGE
ncbi:hypothetical protein G7Y79_00030g064970 [Physcia stellaris]|nr:hypothetical protein G7Y79_00030g064970 [Physcia stellaris]